MFKKVLFLGIFLALSFGKSVFAENPDSLTPLSYVNDYANILNPETTSSLNEKLSVFTKSTGNEISVVTINSLDNYTIEDFANKLFQKWGIGKKNQDNGLLLLISKNDRKVRIEVGYGLEEKITDGIAGDTIRNYITPSFKQNNYDLGVESSINQIINYLQNPNQSVKLDTSVAKIPKLLLFSLVGFVLGGISNFLIFMLLISYLFAFLGRTKSWYLGGIVGTGLGLWYGLTAHSVLIFPAIFGLISGLALDFILSKNYNRWQKLGHKTGWLDTRGGFWSSGRVGGGSSGFGGFGSGRSGGGGASGSW